MNLKTEIPLQICLELQKPQVLPKFFRQYAAYVTLVSELFVWL